MKKNKFLLFVLLCTSLFCNYTKAQKDSVYHSFKGFHFGYTFQNMVFEPAIATEILGAVTPDFKPVVGVSLGLEVSYHFAKYYGVALGVELGTQGVVKAPNLSTFRLSGTPYSIPMHFEFHYPLKHDFWIMADAGGTLRINNSSTIWADEHLNDGSLTSMTVRQYASDWAFQLGAGFYYQFPRAGLLRVKTGINMPLHPFFQGGYTSLQLNPNTGDYLWRGAGKFSSISRYLGLQVAYMHTFQRSKRPTLKRQDWKGVLPRHEFQLNVGDPVFVNQSWSWYDFNFSFWDAFFNTSNRWTSSNRPSSWTETSDEYPMVRYTPVFSLGYHYRLAKWFWLGGTFAFSELSTAYCDRITDEIKQKIHSLHFTVLADARFSYLNRKHVTLYSGLSFGLDFDCDQNGTYYGATFAEQITILGVKAGAKHWFGNLELGAGFKGFVSGGIGYEF